MAFVDQVQAVTVMRVVADIERATTFYVDVLGARLERTHPGEGGFSVVQLFGTWVLLTTPGGPDAGKPNVTLVTPERPERPSEQLIFRVKDCRVAYAELSAQGVTFLAEPHDRGPEIRAFFTDPDGHLFEMSELVDQDRTR